MEKSNLKEAIKLSIQRAAFLSTYLIPTCATLILIDTVYFYRLNSIEQLIDYIQKRRFIITPYNFFNYNSKSENLAKHGSHPIYLHFVNCFLLFGLNFFLILIITLKHRQFIVNTTKSLLILSFIFPLCVFSLVDHKEPRFLLPLLIPMCLLTSHLVFGSQSFRLVRLPWLVFNILAAIVFGYLHQGGVIPATAYTQKMFTHTSNLEIDQHVIFYHTYMPPRYLVEAPVAFNLIQNKR